MSTNYVIYIHTNEKEYKEHWYGLAETIDRVDTLKDCDNVNYIDIVDACTGEIMVTVSCGEVVYIATDDVTIRLYDELVVNY